MVAFIDRASVEYSELQSSRSGAEFFVDITNLYTQDLKTGIQRVVRSILKELEHDFSKDTKVEPVYLVNDSGFWHYRYVNSSPDDYELVVPKAGDSFIGLDFNARIVDAANAGLFHDWRLRGARISFVIYDILPIEHPEWWPPGVGGQHELWLRTVFEASDQLLCISNAVMMAVQQWADGLKDDAFPAPRLAVFHLGADMASSEPSHGLPDDSLEMLENIGSKPSFLMVSTLEPERVTIRL